MAIEYTLLLKNNVISNEKILDKIDSLSLECCSEKKVVDDIIETIGIKIYLRDVDDDNYNVWETDFLGTEFIFKQTICFRMDKIYDGIEQRLHAVFKIIFELMKETKENGILIGSGSEELCYFSDRDTIVLNNESGIWDQKCFSDIILEREVLYL